MKTLIVIDRFEGDFVVCEKANKEMVNIERSKVPLEAQEGDVLVIGDEIMIDVLETSKRKKYIEELTKDLWE